MPITLYCVKMDGSKDWKKGSCSVRRLKKRQTGSGGKLEKLGMKKGSLIMGH